MHNTPKSSIVINDIKIYVKIGHSSNERYVKQPLHLKLIIEHDTIPGASFSDNLEDTVCYKAIIDAVHEFATDKEYSLIEKFALELYNLITDMVKPNKLRVFLTKYPEIDNFSGNVCFEIYEGSR